MPLMWSLKLSIGYSVRTEVGWLVEGARETGVNCGLDRRWWGLGVPLLRNASMEQFQSDALL